ncbi:MAG: ABC transporter permease [Bacteroidota bacterium]
MFKNYFKIAFRNAQKHRSYSLINILGLSIGMAACLAIFYYISFEMSYDDFHKAKENIYRLQLDVRQEGEITYRGLGIAPAVGQDLLEKVPQVQSMTRLWSTDYMNNTVINRSNGEVFSYDLEGVYAAEPSFFEMFSFELAAGVYTDLSKPLTTVITESTASKLFGDADPLQQSVTVSSNIGKLEYEIVGVLKDLPENTHFDFSMLLSMPSMKQLPSGFDIDSWRWNAVLTYLTLDEGTAHSKVLSHINEANEEHNQEYFKAEGINWTYDLQPLRDIHLESDFYGEFKANGDRKVVYALGIIAFFILVIAWVNYINLSTTRAMERAKEVGIRKVLGSSRKQLALQFLSESVIFNLIAVLLAVTIVQVSLPVLRSMTNNPLVIAEGHLLSFWLLTAGLFLLGAVLAGFYPALILSSYQPSLIISGRLKHKRGGMTLRKSLVIFQFVCSIFLIVGTITVYKQISYLKHKELGMNISEMVVLKAPPADLNGGRQPFDAVNNFKTELLRYPQVSSMTISSALPGEAIAWGANDVRPANVEDFTRTPFSFITVDTEFDKTFEVPVIAGRFYRDGDNSWGQGDIVVNEKAVATLGFNSAEEAIGKKVKTGMMPVELTIRGVLQNYHHQSAKENYQPMLFILSVWSNYYSIKLDIDQALAPEDQAVAVKDALATVESTWKRLFPEATFDYFFMDKSFNQQYKADEEFASIFSLFAVLVIIVACLGLFGLSSYAIVQRTKEIGIRKTLGAAVHDIWFMLSKDFMILIVIAGALATPMAYFAVAEWLGNYAFTIPVNAWLFLLPIVLVLIIAAATISFQTARSAFTNPVDALRAE